MEHYYKNAILSKTVPHGWKDTRLKSSHLSYRAMRSNNRCFTELTSLTSFGLKRQVNQIVRLEKAYRTAIALSRVKSSQAV